MLSARLCVLLALSVVAPPTGALAQADSTTSILRRAADASMTYMPRHGELRPPRRGINPRAIQPATSAPSLEGESSHAASIMSSIVSSLGFTVREPSQVCSANGCTLGELSGYLSLSDVRFVGDSAEVFVNVLTPNPRPNAVYRQTFRMMFQRDRCGWSLRSGDELTDGAVPSVSIVYPAKSCP